MSLKNLQDVFGFDSFKTGQQQVIEKVLQGKSACAIFPTGSGKSLCYQLPALQLPGLTLVVSPLLSLMKDQLDFLLSYKVSAARLDSSLERDEYNDVLGRAKSNQLKILMISVERFKNERFRAQLQRMNVSLMVIDEAHCISEWGHNFRPDYLKLPHYQKEFSIPQALLLTATATKKVVADMQTKFAIDEEDVIITGFYRDNLFLHMQPTPIENRQQVLFDTLIKKPDLPSIVYVTLQKTAYEVAEYLRNKGINAHHYHAGMKTEERELIQNQFMQGQINCIVATIAFGMGIDKKDVRRVIHYDLPKSIENYSQEIGRSGRDGRKSLCQILANSDNITVQENFVYGDTPDFKGIKLLLEQIQNSQEPFWETKIITLSNELNIKVLPLKTLLVYLEMRGIIKPKFTYFEEYSFKNCDTDVLINRFQAERKEFIAALFNNCVKKKMWTYVDIQAILDNYATDRARIIVALEYFEQQGLLELQAKQSVERFDIVTREFDASQLAKELFNVFLKKEQTEVQRIHNMIALFESDACLSKELAHYFGEELDFEKCGHCSHCLTGQANFKSLNELAEIETHNFEQLTAEFIHATGDAFSANNLVKYLCGISTSIFRKYKIRALPYFAYLERYPYAQVKTWVLSHLN
jgi:ATP-dependent DNA helicase RecQ